MDYFNKEVIKSPSNWHMEVTKTMKNKPMVEALGCAESRHGVSEY